MKFPGRLLSLTLYIVLSALLASAQLTPNRSGKLDRTYGENGIAAVGPFESVLTDSAVLPDGSILQLRRIMSGTFSISVSKQAPNGEPDTTFGPNGLQTIALPGSISGDALTVLPNGKLIIAGSISANSDWRLSDIFVVRLLPNGVVDTTFGTDGFAIFDLAPSGTSLISREHASSIMVYPDGRLLIAGIADRYVTGDVRADSHAFLLRLDQNGTIDPTFGTDGSAFIQVGENFVNSLSIRQVAARFVAGGKILAGVSAEREHPTSPGTFTRRAQAIRFTADGSTDSTFGLDGRVDLSTFVAPSYFSLALATAESENSKTLVLTSFGLVKLNADGTLDTSFGTDGRVLPTEPCDFIDFTVAPDDKILVNRSCSMPTPSGTRRYGQVERYWPNGLRDRRFGNAGRGLIISPETDVYLGRISAFADNYLIVTGSTGTQATKAISARLFAENKQ